MPGGGYPGDWQQLREVAVKPRKRRKETGARELLFVHFREHRDTCKDFNKDDREEMLRLLMEGGDADVALRVVLDAKAALA